MTFNKNVHFEQYFENFWNFCQISRDPEKFWEKMPENSSIFLRYNIPVRTAFLPRMRQLEGSLNQWPGDGQPHGDAESVGHTGTLDRKHCELATEFLTGLTSVVCAAQENGTGLLMQEIRSTFHVPCNCPALRRVRT